MSDSLERLREASRNAPFNAWLGLVVESAADGRAKLRLPWRDEFGQYTGLLHSGVLAAALETACGFAASSLGLDILASHFAVRCLRPARAETFVVQGWVVKAGRRQVFAASEIFDLNGDPAAPFAVADAVLAPLG